MQRIVITGVSRGLGRALVDGFVPWGHVVFGCARDTTAIASLAKSYPGPSRFDVVDVTDDDSVAGWAAAVLATGDAPDLLINNAGVINRNAPLWEVSAQEASLVVDVNIKGIMNVVRHFVPAMVARGSGVIVNLSSGWGRSVSAEVAPYCATKWAVEGLTRALAEELPAGMAAVPLNPGVIHTEMLESCFGSSAAAYPQPDEWAQKAVALLLRLGPSDNGQPLTV
jgi:NAD(P)-dependent dehydrogenase (short-subunit alcohol dehydrogenase family)